MDANQPNGRMTVMAMSPQLREIEWRDAPQEIEVRLAGELMIFGLTNGISLQRVETRCANPECEGYCCVEESLRLDIGIAPSGIEDRGA